MEPQLASPEFQGGHSKENEPVLTTQETGYNLQPSPEASIASPEQAKNAEQLSVDRQAPITPLVTQQTPVPPKVDDATQDATIISETPATARDDDVIEKEWISKVKSVIKTTSDDPYKQQSMISRLVANYVLKRYNRKIGETEG